MNRSRRNVLNVVLDNLKSLQDIDDKTAALNILQNAQDQVEKCADEEETALDNRPESFQWSAGNDIMSDNVSDLHDAHSDLEILTDRCQDMGVFDYKIVQNDVIKIVNKIKETIHR